MENIMNKAYNYKSKFNAYESNCNIIKISREDDNTSALDALGYIIGKIFSQRALSAIKAIIATLCFFGFIGVIGGVDAGTISLGGGIVISFCLILVEILCLRTSKKKQ